MYFFIFSNTLSLNILCANNIHISKLGGGSGFWTPKFTNSSPKDLYRVWVLLYTSMWYQKNGIVNGQELVQVKLCK